MGGRPVPGARPAPASYTRDIARETIDGARQRGLDPYIILSPTVLPGLPGGHSMSGGTGIADAIERPLPVDGVRSTRIIAGTGCPNNPAVQRLVLAQVQESLDHYGDAAGFFFDWLEYTCYLLEDVFTCVCPSCREEAARQELDWDRLAGALRHYHDRLHRLTNRDLEAMIEAGSTGVLLDETVSADLAAFWAFKARSVANLLHLIATTVRASQSPGVALAANGFPAPWSTMTGAQFEVSAPYVDQVHPKFFTFHWAMMVRWYGQSLRQWNPDLDEALLVRAILRCFDIEPADGDYRRLLSDFGMPGPTQPHPLTASDVRRKVEIVTRAVAGLVQVSPYIHGYQPVDTFDALVGVMEATPIDGVWVQRYGYLSEEKLDALKSHWRR